ncbi:GGDEF domain-containing protein [Nucisporomicrobium flavum]|uniref:GGDEF domain-containing protein n=1 Tax=Nucisporomicrobium flavum TaxID=2785915 RepID=UPI0027DC1D56|nr:GGDEF domain-containing protein [Nucisporomicrobium flavum]
MGAETVEATIESLVADVYVSHAGLAGRAAELVRRAEAAGDRRHADLGRLVIAELHSRGGRVAEGVRQAREVLAATDDRIVVAHAHAVIAGGLWRIGDNADAVRHAYPANRMLVDGDPPVLRVDHAIILALQVNDQRIGGISHGEFRAAQQLADDAGVPALILANLNNWAWCSYTHGDLQSAAALVRRMQEHSVATGEPLNASCADTVARILLETGRSAEATAVIEQAVASAQPTDSDAIPAALITLADIQRRDGNIGTALRTLEECRRMAARDHLPDVDALALRMIAGCHAELGDFRAAYQEMVDFHEAWTLRRSERSEVVARVAHAQYAVDEAQRTTERFREMAERDALTGLWNRRRSDAHLAAALATPAAPNPPAAPTPRDAVAAPRDAGTTPRDAGARSGDPGAAPRDAGARASDAVARASDAGPGMEVPAGPRGAVSVALLDLDHFKLINDTFSHAVGDVVLRRVAAILAEAGGHAGRHGGEEFILILDVERAEAARRCEALRAAIHAHAWDSVAAGLRVTASIGLAVLRPGDDAYSVVRRADENLYAAKRAGRNRLVAE